MRCHHTTESISFSRKFAKRICIFSVLFLLVFTGKATEISAQKVTIKQVDSLSQLPLDRWKKLREVERYQLNIAEKYYRNSKLRNYKVATGEYTKYLSLYERSDAAPYVQLMWSNCQVRLKKQNTAINDGYQSIIDYWPESKEAIVARYLIGRTRKQMGELRNAKKSLKEVIQKHPKHTIAAMALADLVEISLIEKDEAGKIALWKTMTFDIPREKGAMARNSVRNQLCGSASQMLAKHYFKQLAFDDAVKSLAATFPEQSLPYYVYVNSQPAVSVFAVTVKTKPQSARLADLSIAYIRQRIPTDLKDPTQKLKAIAYWYHIVDLNSYSGRDNKVLETYEQIAKIFGNDDSILGRLAGWYRSRRRYDEARSTYLKYKNKLEGKSAIAYTYREQGNYTQAATTYRQALALDPENPVRWKPLVAQALRDGKKIDEAVAVYNELIKDDAKDPQGWRFQIAYTYHHYASPRRYKQAIAIYRLCGDKFPANYWAMADCHYRLKQFKECILLYGQIAAGSEGDAPRATWSKALAYEQLKNENQAVQTFRLLCKRYPRNGFASQAHVHLKKKYNINITFGGAKKKD